MANRFKVFQYILEVIQSNATEEKKSYRFLKSAIKHAEAKFGVEVGKIQKLLDKAGNDFDRYKKQKIVIWKCIQGSAEENNIPQAVLSAEFTCRSMRKRGIKNPKIQIKDEEALTPEEIAKAEHEQIMEDAHEEEETAKKEGEEDN